MTTIADYRSLSPEVQAHIAQIEDFIGDMENAELADGSTVYAEDVVVALNGLIAALAPTRG
jgi:hypothetical protein